MWLILRRLRTTVHFWKRWGRITKGCGTMTEKGWFVGYDSALINRIRISPVRREPSSCIAACYPSLRPTTKSSWQGSERSAMMILSLPFTLTRTTRSATFICMSSPGTSFCANFRQRSMIGKRSQLHLFWKRRIKTKGEVSNSWTSLMRLMACSSDVSSSKI